MNINKTQKRKVFGVRLNAAELATLSELAARCQRTRGDMLRYILRRYAKAARAEAGQ